MYYAVINMYCAILSCIVLDAVRPSEVETGTIADGGLNYYFIYSYPPLILLFISMIVSS